MERPYKALGYPIVPMFYIVMTTLICAILFIYDTKNTGFGLAIVLLGIPVYYFTQRKNKVKQSVFYFALLIFQSFLSYFHS